ncbi:hypothetical protein [Burkholderia pyrrocinia]
MFDWLPQYHWEDVDHVQHFATDWMWTDNPPLCRMALGDFMPKQQLAMVT